MSDSGTETLTKQSQELLQQLKEYDFAKMKDVISQKRGYAERCKLASQDAIRQINEQLEELTPEMLKLASTLDANFSNIIDIDYERAQQDLEYTVRKQQEITNFIALLYEKVKEELNVQYSTR